MIVCNIDPLSFLDLVEMDDGSAATDDTQVSLQRRGLTRFIWECETPPFCVSVSVAGTSGITRPPIPGDMTGSAGPKALYLNSPTLLTGNPDDAPPRRCHRHGLHDPGRSTHADPGPGTRGFPALLADPRSIRCSNSSIESLQRV